MENNNEFDINLRPVVLQEEGPARRKVSVPLASRILRWSGATLIAASAVVFGMATWEIVGSDLAAGQSQDEFAALFEERSEGSTATTPSSPAAQNQVDDGSVSPGFTLPEGTEFADPLFGSGQRPGSLGETVEVDTTATTIAPFERGAYGDLAGRILIPAIDVDFYVTFGTDLDALATGPGVWEYGTVPGNPGNATIAGHRTTYGAPFRHLDSLEVGDRIEFQTTDGRKSIFEVRGSAVVLPENVTVTYQTEGVRLTLTTCTPVGSTRERLIIQAELIEGDFIDFALPASDWSFQGEL